MADEDTAEIEAWVARDYARAYRTACLIMRNPTDAADAVQEAFLRVWRFRDAIPPPPARTAWLYRVVVNSCMSRFRADPHRHEQPGEHDLTGRPDPESSPAEAAEHRELAALVLASLAELPELLRVPLVLRYYSGLSEREIATAIQRRPGTVKSRLSEGRRRLGGDARLAAWVSREEAG
jgi:RNA polymerase sigma-70 factor (ECF subfamily)